jgi:hypothetical protein
MRKTKTFVEFKTDSFYHILLVGAILLRPALCKEKIPMQLKTQTERGITTKNALRFVVLVGIVSLFADMTYEGARSINGPFLAILGASGAVVGIVSGLGELIGYALRLV